MTEEAENGAEAIWQEVLAGKGEEAEQLGRIEQLARASTRPCEVVFGTSGWRGIIGSDFTFRNVRIVTAAVVEMYRHADDELRAALGIDDFADFHDNRFLGPDFAADVIGVLAAAGVAARYAGEAITPEFSAALALGKAAGAMNLTPSHNPADWAGVKFNPADGGPAGTEITGVIERIANRMMFEGDEPATTPVAKPKRIDLAAAYQEFVAARGTIDLACIRKFVETEDVLICIDHVHGATRGRPERLLGTSPKVHCLRTEDDPLFGRLAPEPSSANMALAKEELRASTAKYRLGVIMDPDGDRIRFCDADTELPMNCFGALALHFLHRHKKLSGWVLKSVATSNFANALAARMGLPIAETKVGFKNFRPHLLPGSEEMAIIAFEESDGISGYNHTLEKDAIFGLLLAIEMMATTKMNLGDYLRSLQTRFGCYFPERAGIEVDRALSGGLLREKLGKIAEMFKPGDEVRIGSGAKKVEAIGNMDGTKIVFDDGSWLLIRPSGTEPKVRFYVETRAEAEKVAMFRKAEELTRAALAG